MISEYVLPTFDEARKETMQIEKEAIERLSTPEEVVRFMRKQIEISNRDFLCRKAVSMGGELWSLITDKLMKNGIDTFIECAVLILSRAEEVYIDRIAVEFPQFRNSYARAEATVLLAYRGRKDALKSIYDEYTELSHSKDPEIYRLSQTVLYSIYMLTGIAERLQELRDELDDLADEFKDLINEEDFETEDLKEVTHLLSVDALNAVTEAEDKFSDYLYEIEDDTDMDPDTDEEDE